MGKKVYEARCVNCNRRLSADEAEMDDCFRCKPLERIAKLERLADAADHWRHYESLMGKLDDQEIGDAGDAYADLIKAIDDLNRPVTPP